MAIIRDLADSGKFTSKKYEISRIDCNLRIHTITRISSRQSFFSTRSHFWYSWVTVHFPFVLIKSSVQESVWPNFLCSNATVTSQLDELSTLPVPVWQLKMVYRDVRHFCKALVPTLFAILSTRYRGEVTQSHFGSSDTYVSLLP